MVYYLLGIIKLMLSFAIIANDALLKTFGKCKENSTRLLKVSIVDGKTLL